MATISLEDIVLTSSVQCLYGFTPFACENRNDTKMKILVSWPRQTLLAEI